MTKYGVRHILTPIGDFYIVSSNLGIVRISWKYKRESNIVGKRHLDVAEKWIKMYFEGKGATRPDLDYQRLTKFSCDVIKTLIEKIGFGEVISYGNLAKMTNGGKASRAVGSVMARNPWPIMVPCHRVIKSDGDVGEYSIHGYEVNSKERVGSKKWLLKHEENEIINNKIVR
jgi:O-6-methylguanine DNA methyltransferase|tara:strand:- start:1752 stop:2267 length:516 start_codon:yes stop_codon:yes gene_type:complete